MNETNGTNMLVVDSLNNNSEEITANTPHRGTSKTKLLDRLELGNVTNEYVESEALARIKETESVFEIGLAGIDIDVLTPNKRFTFIFEDTLYQKKLGGVYRLYKVASTFAPKGTSLNISSLCTFLKIK